MKRYILDTNIVSKLQTQTEFGLKILNKLENLKEDDEVSISVIVLYELVYGLRNISNKEQRDNVKKGIDFIKEYLSIIPLDTKEIDIFANLKTKYKKATGINKNAIKRHNLDLLIASSAIATNSIIISDDTIFKKLSEIEPLLKYDNWLR